MLPTLMPSSLPLPLKESFCCRSMFVSFACCNGFQYRNEGFVAASEETEENAGVIRVDDSSFSSEYDDNPWLDAVVADYVLNASSFQCSANWITMRRERHNLSLSDAETLVHGSLNTPRFETHDNFPFCDLHAPL